MRHQAVDKSKGHHPGAKSMRWKSALSDTEESDAFDSESGLDSNVSTPVQHGRTDLVVHGSWYICKYQLQYSHKKKY